MEHGLIPYQKFIKNVLYPFEELSYTIQKGKTQDIECVVVKSNGTREGNGDLPATNWRLEFTNDEEKEGLYLEDVDIFYGHFISVKIMKKVPLVYSSSLSFVLANESAYTP
ncbi:MAG: hypothetical protein Q9M36_06745 [Sulfurovum sp.]|nr:hypothetical protein [Sulfurovum sp.]